MMNQENTNNKDSVTVIDVTAMNNDSMKNESKTTSTNFLHRSKRALKRMGTALDQSGRAIHTTGRALVAGGKASTRVGRAMAGGHTSHESIDSTTRRAPINIYETNDSYMLRCELPGCSSDTISVTHAGQDLWITASSMCTLQDGTPTRTHLQESELGNYQRHIRLGHDIDTEGCITAKCCSGVLVICLPKRATKQRKTIHVDLA